MAAFSYTSGMEYEASVTTREQHAAALSEAMSERAAIACGLPMDSAEYAEAVEDYKRAKQAYEAYCLRAGIPAYETYDVD